MGLEKSIFITTVSGDRMQFSSLDDGNLKISIVKNGETDADYFVLLDREDLTALLCDFFPTVRKPRATKAANGASRKRTGVSAQPLV